MERDPTGTSREKRNEERPEDYSEGRKAHHAEGDPRLLTARSLKRKEGSQRRADPGSLGG